MAASVKHALPVSPLADGVGELGARAGALGFLGYANDGDQKKGWGGGISHLYPNTSPLLGGLC